MSKDIHEEAKLLSKLSDEEVIAYMVDKYNMLSFLNDATGVLIKEEINDTKRETM